MKLTRQVCFLPLYEYYELVLMELTCRQCSGLETSCCGMGCVYCNANNTRKY